MWCAVVLRRWTRYIALHQIKLNRCTALLLAMYTPAAASSKVVVPPPELWLSELSSGGYCELSPVPRVQHQEKLHNCTTTQLHNYTTTQLHNCTPELWLWWTHFWWILSPVPPVPPCADCFPYKCFHLYQTKPSFPLVLIAKLTTITSTNANISYVYHLIIISQSPLAPHVALICLHEFVSGWDVR